MILNTTTVFASLLTFASATNTDEASTTNNTPPVCNPAETSYTEHSETENYSEAYLKAVELKAEDDKAAYYKYMDDYIENCQYGESSSSKAGNIIRNKYIVEYLKYRLKDALNIIAISNKRSNETFNKKSKGKSKKKKDNENPIEDSNKQLEKKEDPIKSFKEYKELIERLKNKKFDVKDSTVVHRKSINTINGTPQTDFDRKILFEDLSFVFLFNPKDIEQITGKSVSEYKKPGEPSFLPKLEKPIKDENFSVELCSLYIENANVEDFKRLYSLILGPVEELIPINNYSILIGFISKRSGEDELKLFFKDLVIGELKESLTKQTALGSKTAQRKIMFCFSIVSIYLIELPENIISLSKHYFPNKKKYFVDEEVKFKDEERKNPKYLKTFSDAKDFSNQILDEYLMLRNISPAYLLNFVQEPKKACRSLFILIINYILDKTDIEMSDRFEYFLESVLYDKNKQFNKTRRCRRVYFECFRETRLMCFPGRNFKTVQEV